MYLLIHTHGHIEVSHYAFRSFENTAEGIGMVLWNLQSEDLVLSVMYQLFRRYRNIGHPVAIGVSMAQLALAVYLTVG
jgi:hypothetical protein